MLDVFKQREGIYHGNRFPDIAARSHGESKVIGDSPVDGEHQDGVVRVATAAGVGDIEDTRLIVARRHLSCRNGGVCRQVEGIEASAVKLHVIGTVLAVRESRSQIIGHIHIDMQTVR